MLNRLSAVVVAIVLLSSGGYFVYRALRSSTGAHLPGVGPQESSWRWNIIIDPNLRRESNSYDEKYHRLVKMRKHLKLIEDI